VEKFVDFFPKASRKGLNFSLAGLNNNLIKDLIPSLSVETVLIGWFELR
jgi:hypothetical protein